MDALAAYGSDASDAEPDEERHGAAPVAFKRLLQQSWDEAAASSDAAPAAKRPHIEGWGILSQLPDPLALLSSSSVHIKDSLVYSSNHQQHQQPQQPQQARKQQQPQQQMQAPALQQVLEKPAARLNGHSCSSSSSKDGDEPSLPIRSFPHVEGNFATVVYIKLPQHQGVRLLFEQLLSSLPSGGGLPKLYPLDTPAKTRPATTTQQPHISQAVAFKQPPTSQPPASTQLPINQPAAAKQLPFHISLSRTVAIRQEQARPLLACLSKRLKGSKAATISLRGLEVLVNDERTRTFVALRVEHGEGEVRHMIRAVDAAFQQHGLQTFYEDPKPHVSFAWALGDHWAALQAALAAAPPPGDAHLEVPMAQVVCRVGQRENVIWSGTR